MYRREAKKYNNAWLVHEDLGLEALVQSLSQTKVDPLLRIVASRRVELSESDFTL